MIRAATVDLSHNFELAIVDRDCDLDFPGYSVDPNPGVDNSVHLVKIGSVAQA
jgi:hypothetical protein